MYYCRPSEAGNLTRFMNGVRSQSSAWFPPPSVARLRPCNFILREQFGGSSRSMSSEALGAKTISFGKHAGKTYEEMASDRKYLSFKCPIAW